MAFTADGKVAHASAGWPTAIMAQGFMAKGLHADHWHSVGVQRVRALSNDVANSAFRPGWLALGRARLDQLGGRELHGRGRPVRRAPILSPSASACWILVWPRTPSVERSAKRRSSNVRRRRQAGLRRSKSACRVPVQMWSRCQAPCPSACRQRRARAGPTAAAVR
jgi:hypothetical protein